MRKREILPCPFCGSKVINTYAFYISSDCCIECADCGATIETEVPWREDETTEEHDKRCDEKLINLWNRRMQK